MRCKNCTTLQKELEGYKSIIETKINEKEVLTHRLLNSREIKDKQMNPLFEELIGIRTSINAKAFEAGFKKGSKVRRNAAKEKMKNMIKKIGGDHNYTPIYVNENQESQTIRKAMKNTLQTPASQGKKKFIGYLG
jgi:uncharacterized membrane protein YgaE (UPF0421/DUF939 family)